MGHNRHYVREGALTDPQQRFALALAAGMNQTEAARVAGYSAPSVAGTHLAQHEGVRQVVRARRNRRLDKLASLSLWELEVMIRDRDISPAVRFNAIKLSLGLAGHVEPKANPDEAAKDLSAKAISEMSIDELDAVIAKERAKRADAARPIIDQVTSQTDV